MSDDTTFDPDQPGEEVDESLPDEFPPDRPVGLEGLIGDETDDDDVVLNGDDDEDDEDDLRLEETEDGFEEVGAGPDDPGPLAEDDEFTGDESLRDYATERVPPPAEEIALHVEPDGPADL